MTGSVKLTTELDFLLDLDELKNVERQNPLASSPRRERVAEHSWSLAMAAILLRDEASEAVDLGRAVTLAVVHDVVERLVGDTFAFGHETQGQFHREHEAMARLENDNDDSPGILRMIEYWREYEDQKTPEARFVKGLDALLPIAQNYLNLEHSSWRKHHVEADKVLARLNNHGDVGETLRPMGEGMIADAKALGYLT
jgi:putative hydrolase of HD superfamily